MTTNRVHFCGDASLPGSRHPGHFVYAPERNGVPVYMCSGVPRELWGTSPGNWTTHEFDHAHLLPWVQVRPEHRVCREWEFGNNEHHARCCCSEGRTEGQAPGTAKITYTANYTVLACWDYTGDMRGNSWSLFWVQGRLSTNDMVATIVRDFPRLWARITKPVGMATHGGDPEPAPVNVIEHVAASEEPRQATSIDEVFPGLWESLVGTTLDLTQESASPVVTERAKTA